MTRTILLSTAAIALLGSAAMLAHAQQPAQLQPQVASFFIADNPSGAGNLGGLAGADQICQNEAQSLGGQAAARTWHAYLSQEQRGNQPRINARDRVGTGPWYNVKGQLIASNVADLHGDQQRDRNNVQRATAIGGMPTPTTPSCGARIFVFIRSPCAHAPQKSWCASTARSFHTAWVKTRHAGAASGGSGVTPIPDAPEQASSLQLRATLRHEAHGSER
jgi:hypothetical protein